VSAIQPACLLVWPGWSFRGVLARTAVREEISGPPSSPQLARTTFSTSAP
jgi:hypothetical protein